ncbi:siderophore biosynthesis protein [Alcanivorax nanhaiticus]|uniref:Siderophore biosynthesis protein n=1 Tax=Alcanivorax nanhaiticus TaxID=1177154 RepID=A0A095SIH8_9GAMM|nr:lysine N(6)-hydroxylase/L-ornithine N(5)-oxygenase family protein [Alcanivorax nanhaiticus]KGD64387.1 siderophore biosynthesis protein [Alcanivorax nanhaiticus]
MPEQTYDLIGVGLGPFNLSLACLAEPVEGLTSRFFDERPGFDWHPGLMLPDVHLQTPFMSDLVTLADPTSPYSFLNYSKQQGRLYAFYIRENFFLLRQEYNQYCQWAAQRLGNVAFGCRVTAVAFEDTAQRYRLTVANRQQGTTETCWARKIVLGTGPTPYLPEGCEALGDGVIHAGDYLHHREALQQQQRITVVGSGQSAAEIFYDLLEGAGEDSYRLSWITRSPRFFPLEYTKLTLEMTSPEYVDYFHALPESTRDGLIADQTSLYKGINSELINAIYDLLYRKQLSGPVPVDLITNASLMAAHRNRTDNALVLDFHHQEQGRDFVHRTDAMVLATGYRYQEPDCLAGLSGQLRRDAHGRLDPRRDYSIDHRGDIFIQNGPVHRHGFVTPDLGMACYRNAHILRSITGREPYGVEEHIAFQCFGAPADGLRNAQRESA